MIGSTKRRGRVPFQIKKKKIKLIKRRSKRKSETTGKNQSKVNSFAVPWKRGL